MHQNVDDFNCRICNKAFENISSYDMHMKLHSDKPNVERYRKKSKAELAGKKLPFPCGYCKREFQRPHEKVKHERIHTGKLQIIHNNLSSIFFFLNFGACLKILFTSL